MKQIQEWLGHASYTTTADTYSHLDYSAKVQSASAIASALNQPNLSPFAQNRADFTMLKSLLKEMDDKGFSSIDEYIKYLENTPNPAKSDQEPCL